MSLLARTDIFIGGDTVKTNIRDSILSMSLSSSMREVAQLTINISDEADFSYLASGLFATGKIITGGTDSGLLLSDYEIASIEVSDSPAPYNIRIAARSVPAQFFKKTKTALVTTTTPNSFIFAEAQKVGGSVVAQPAPSRTISRVNNEQQQESTWDAVKKVARELKYEFWEYGGTFYFGKKTYWVDQPVKWLASYDAGQPRENPSNYDFSGASSLTLYGLPICRRSEDSRDQIASVRLAVDREDARKMAPGDVVYFSGIPNWEERYIVTQIELDLLSNASTGSVSLETVKPVPQKGKSVGAANNTNAETYGEIFPAPGAVNIDPLIEYLSDNNCTAPPYPFDSGYSAIEGYVNTEISACRTRKGLVRPIYRPGLVQ